MNRRNFLTYAALASVAGLLFPLSAAADSAVPVTPGLPVSPTGTVLVELINLHCPRCRAINDYVPRIEQAATAAGLLFRVAPVAWEGQSLWPDRVYYAARDKYPGSEKLVREFLFDGLQRDGMVFENLEQTMAYLVRRELPKQLATAIPNLNLALIAEYAGTDAPLVSEMKAGRLIDLTLAQEVPVFAWVNNGEVIGVVSPKDAAEPISLVNAVLTKLTAPVK